MRVIGGEARGRRLVAPTGRTTRPTSDRVREALFSTLGPRLPGARVLDLYAGSGALAIEALSRGAGHASLVESHRRAVAAIRRNLAATGYESHASVVEATVAAFCRRGGDAPYDLVLVDPPYAEPLATVYTHLVALAEGGGLASDADVVIERDKRDPELGRTPPEILALLRTRSYGDTVLLHLRMKESPP